MLNFIGQYAIQYGLLCFAKKIQKMGHIVRATIILVVMLLAVPNSSGVGPQGPQGPQGASVVGPQGPQGPQGSSTGAQGPQGPQGPQGDSIVGPQGPQGASVVGPQGPQGDSVVGPQGPQGDSVVGPQGPQGPQGVAGTGGANTLATSATSVSADWVGFSAPAITLTKNDNNAYATIRLTDGVSITFNGVAPTNFVVFTMASDVFTGIYATYIPSRVVLATINGNLEAVQFIADSTGGTSSFALRKLSGGQWTNGDNLGLANLFGTDY